MSFLCEPLRILSDGKVMYCILDSVAYKIHDSYITQLSLSINPNLIDVSFPTGQREFIAGLCETNISFDVKAGKCEAIREKDILLDFFNSASIRDLFKAINRKIEKTR